MVCGKGFLIRFLHWSRVNDTVANNYKVIYLCLSGLDSVPHGMEEVEMQGLGSDQGAGLDSNSKLSEFANRPGK